ncbi:unnamed protein product [Chondrus crispus]|uniref:Rubisco accumulation factor 1 C-terminal domain-containing protein n=1 Tax=Chondrus crispus TaxID=2769 RepID=R7QT97_CHOCR|nr:unnamed protein product [Chondrus crispus]CDF40736.1 unnamed protein product [Chondrus crispus]|eukprot:XP_005711030.1 unnamed protein product [Chondrus crispus]
MGIDTAFVPFSTFAPGLRPASRAAPVCSRNQPKMIARENVQGSEEIKRLQKKLEELRAMRERIAKEKSVPPPQASTPPPQAPAQPAVQNVTPSNNTNLSFALGKHGEGSRFLSMSAVEAEEHFPRILTVAGRVPELTVKEFMETPPVLQNRPPNAGNMFVTMLPPGYQGQIIAMQGLEVIAKCMDPVAVLIPAEELSAAQLSISDDADIAVVVERNVSKLDFDKTKFYAWAVGGRVKVGWVKEMPSPDNAKCLGQVVFGMLEEKEELRKKKSCWEEENETYSA